MTTCSPSAADNWGWMMRATVSVPLPAANGTIHLTGRVGYWDWAAARPAAAKISTASAARAIVILSVVIAIGVLPQLSAPTRSGHIVVQRQMPVRAASATSRFAAGAARGYSPAI